MKKGVVGVAFGDPNQMIWSLKTKAIQRGVQTRSGALKFSTVQKLSVSEFWTSKELDLTRDAGHDQNLFSSKKTRRCKLWIWIKEKGTRKTKKDGDEIRRETG